MIDLPGVSSGFQVAQGYFHPMHPCSLLLRLHTSPSLWPTPCLLPKGSEKVSDQVQTSPPYVCKPTATTSFETKGQLVNFLVPWFPQLGSGYE